MLFARLKVYEMGGARSTMAEVENKMKGKDHLEEPEVDARIAL